MAETTSFAELDGRPEYFELLPRVVDATLEYLRDLPERPVVVPCRDEELRLVMGGPLPTTSSHPQTVLDKLLRGGELGVVPSGSSRYYGYVIGGVLPIALAADWLTSVWDQCGIVHDSSPLTSALEDIAGKWIVDLFRLPTNTEVSFTPSCTYANLICLAAARHAVLSRHGWDVEAQGLQGAPKVTVLVSETSHAAVLRSLRVLGLGGNIRRVPTDRSGRIAAAAYVTELERAGDGPLIVCAQVGEVNTGAVDSIDLLCSGAREVGGWVHLDGAFGLWAAATERRTTMLAGLEAADSWATDAHKWLNVPYDCGVALVADGEAHRKAVEISPDYLHQDNPLQRHSVKWGLNISQRARVIPVWAALAQMGSDGVADMVNRHCALARHLARLLSAEPGIDVVNEVWLNQVAVRFQHATIGADLHTESVSKAFQQDGVGWASTSRWNGQAILRISIVNWATSEDDIVRTAESLIARHRQLLSHAHSRDDAVVFGPV